MIDNFYYKMFLGKKNKDKQRQTDHQQSEKNVIHIPAKGLISLDTRGKPSKSRKVGKGHEKMYTKNDV